MACTESLVPRGKGTAAGEGVAEEPEDEGGGSGERAGGARGAGEQKGRWRRAAPLPRAASVGHPRAQPLLVHRSLRQVRAGRGEELFSPASLRGVREINEADLYTIQFIAWKEGGVGGKKCHLYPPAHSAPARQQSTGRGCRSLSRSAPRRSVVPVQRLLLLNVPSKLTWSIAGEGAGVAGKEYAAGSSTVASLLTTPRIISKMLYFQSSAEGLESGEDAAAAPGAGPPAGNGTARCASAERGIVAIPAIPGEAARIHSVRPALRLTPSLVLFKQNLPCWWFGVYYYYC